MEPEVSLIPMTGEMYHAYFKEFENTPDLYMDPRDFVPYVYEPEKVDRYIRKQSDLKRKCFGILYEGEIVGELLIKNIIEGQSATLSLCLKNARYKDRGIGTRAEALAIGYVFEELDIPLLYADTILTNTRSQHVLEKLGFHLLKEEGDFRYYAIER